MTDLNKRQIKRIGDLQPLEVSQRGENQVRDVLQLVVARTSAWKREGEDIIINNRITCISINKINYYKTP